MKMTGWMRVIIAKNNFDKNRKVMSLHKSLEIYKREIN